MRAMLDVPEVTVLGAAMGRTGSTLLGTLTSLWSGEAIGGQNVNEAKRLRVPEYGYRVALVTGVQPGNADILMQEDVTGLPQRILWATTRDPDAPQERPHRPSGDLGFDAGKLSKLQPSEFEIDGLYQAGGYEKCRSENGNIVYPFHVIEYPAAVFEEVDADGLNRLHGARPDGMDGHSLLVTIKTAGLLAILEQRVGAALIVTEEDWQRAKYIVAKSRQTREVCVNDSRIIRRGKRCERLADDLIAKSEAKEAVNYERYARRITKALGKYDNEHEGIKGYMIQRKTGIPTSDTYQTISRMYEEGLLEKIGPEVEGTGSQLWALSSVRP
ncbi:DnaB domain-containing protein helicase domain-containing protein [Bifidobacterium myosotis]|uniref:DnaB domain-containing protein helicase domain-containing protein n=2 Tax=Bifidobacterium myosotis TaxID=1630166 RepID=A0A261FR55_9BIFI|nr:DnaB domain-containing protein helicase domain-containing protein [Bifidobacterium myosotis]